MLKGVKGLFKEVLKFYFSISWGCQGCFLQECLNGISRVFQESTRMLSYLPTLTCFVIGRNMIPDLN